MQNNLQTQICVQVIVNLTISGCSFVVKQDLSCKRQVDLAIKVLGQQCDPIHCGIGLMAISNDGRSSSTKRSHVERCPAEGQQYLTTTIAQQ